MRWGEHDTIRTRYNSGEPDEGRNNLWGKIFTTAEVLSDVGLSALMARGRFRPVDYIALGTKAVHGGMRLWNLWSFEQPMNLSKFFDYEGSPWKLCAYFPCRYAFEGLEIHEQIVEDHKISKGGKVVSAAWTAVVEGVEIGWTGAPSQDTVPDQIWSKTPENIRDVAAKRLWDKAGHDKVLRIHGDRTYPVFLPEALVETQFLRMVEKRARQFLDKRKPRAMIMDGEPGTGKTTAAAHMAKRLGFRTVVMNVEDFVFKTQVKNGGYEAVGAELAEMLKPDVLIVNDIDRIQREHQLPLLDAFDNAKSYSRIIFVTTNHYRNLIEPVRRPGRLGDLIKVPGLSREEIALVAPDLAHMSERMLGWPIDYVRDMQDRYETLGEAAIAEFDEVANRLAEVRADGKYAVPVQQSPDHGDRGDQGEPSREFLAAAAKRMSVTEKEIHDLLSNPGDFILTRPAANSPGPTESDKHLIK